MYRTRSKRGSPCLQTRSGAATLFDQHGAALLALAIALTGDRRQASEAVVEVICAAHPASLPATDVRQDLAERLYLHCDPELPGTTGELEEFAMALTYCGGLNHREVAYLLEVPEATVVRILNSTLQRERFGGGWEKFGVASR